MQSDVIRCHQRSSEVIRGHQWGRVVQCARVRPVQLQAVGLGRVQLSSGSSEAINSRVSSEVIRGHPWSSEVIKGHQRSSRTSEVIRGHQRSSEVIRGHQRSSEVIRGHQRIYGATRESADLPRGWLSSKAHPRSSVVIRCNQSSSVVISGHQRPSKVIHCASVRAPLCCGMRVS